MAGGKLVEIGVLSIFGIIPIYPPTVAINRFGPERPQELVSLTANGSSHYNALEH
jgi:hypothetical protein